MNAPTRIQAAPAYPDRSHPIYRALVIADALDRLNELQDEAYEALLLEIGDDATGGLSTCGFRHDLITHVQSAEADLAIQQKDEWLEDHGWHRSDECPQYSGYGAGVDAAAQWLDDVAAGCGKLWPVGGVEMGLRVAA